MLAKITLFLAGKKTYLAAAGLVITALVDVSAGDYVGAGKTAMAALGLFGIRSAIAQS
jgi:hypothetical protein